MLDKPLAESEMRSWLYVLAAVLIIFTTIPIARALREMVREQFGLQYFFYLTLGLILLGAYFAFDNLRRRRLPPGAWLCLLAVFALFTTYLYQLREIPEEALHVAEYGLLGLLVYRALTHRIRDYGIYPAAILIVGMIGVLDEYIQWLIPSRYFDLRDIYTNIIAGALAQAAIATGLRPGMIRVKPGVRTWSRLCYLGAVFLLLLAIGFMNTPQRIAGYASSVPFLSYLMNSTSMMVEYGYRYDDPEIGVFRSRFSREQLDRLDRERGEEVAAIIDKYIRGEGYRAFQSVYSVPRDAFTHEVGVHLFRREFHLDRAREKNNRLAEHYTNAYRENQILEKYFPSVMAFSRHRWDRAIEIEVETQALKAPTYESPVSKSVITRLNEWQVLASFMLSFAVLTLLGMYLGRLSQAQRAK